MVSFLLGVIAVLLAALLGVMLDVRKSVNKFDNTARDLYEKHNALDKRMVHVEVVHEIRGCELPQGARA